MTEDERKLLQEAQLLALKSLQERLRTVDRLKCETIFMGSNELRCLLQEGNKSFDWVEDNSVYRIAKGEITKVLWEEEEQETFQEGLTNVTKT